ncbi:MAG: hypothetical protein D6681_16500, partial [Calditrichaeota bacterium]
SRELFVEWRRQHLAEQAAERGETQFQIGDELLKALEQRVDQAAVPPEDTLKAIEEFNRGAQHLLALKQLGNNPALDEATLRQQAFVHLDSARFFFEQAIRLNPFDRKARHWLARTYQQLAKNFLHKENWVKAAETLEKLIRMDRGQHGLYATLGQVYMALEDWDKALRNFRTAEQVLRETAVFRVPEDQPLNDSTIAAALDSSALFLYTYYQGENYIHLYQADSALAAFERAGKLARTENDRESVQASVEWINWDGGNIYASEFRDQLLELVDKGEYEKAADGFQLLLKRLRTERARREIRWRLALLEFTFLGREDQALERMREVVKFYQTDTTGTALADTLYREYYNTYGTMCHNLGLKALKQKKLRTALAYFMQAVEIPWKQQAKSYVEIAKLSINNPRRAAEAAEKALAHREQLAHEETIQALRIMIESLKRLGRFQEAAEYYRQYREQSALAN